MQIPRVAATRRPGFGRYAVCGDAPGVSIRPSSIYSTLVGGILVLPRIREPMAATSIAKPFHRPGWVYEEKYDGWRMVAYKDGTAVRLVSRAGKEHSQRFATPLAAAIRALPAMSSSSTVKSRSSMTRSSRVSSGSESGPRMSRRRRRSTWPSTASISRGATSASCRFGSVVWSSSGCWETPRSSYSPARRLAADGLEAWAQVVKRGYEGLVARTRPRPTAKAARSPGSR